MGFSALSKGLHLVNLMLLCWLLSACTAACPRPPPAPINAAADNVQAKMHEFRLDKNGKTVEPNDLTCLDNSRYRQEELIRVLEGVQYGKRKLGSPTPLGLAAFAMTMFLLSVYSLEPFGIRHPNVVAGVCLFYGGVVMVLAGMWELALDNALGALTFTSYGAFWLSYGAILTDAFGMISAYPTPQEASAAVGILILGWLIFSVLLTICSLRATVAIFALFVVLDLALISDIVFAFTGKILASKIGAVLGIIASILAWYSALAGIVSKSNSFFELKPWYMPGSRP